MCGLLPLLRLYLPFMLLFNANDDSSPSPRDLHIHIPWGLFLILCRRLRLRVRLGLILCRRLPSPGHPSSYTVTATKTPATPRRLIGGVCSPYCPKILSNQNLILLPSILCSDRHPTRPHGTSPGMATSKVTAESVATLVQPPNALGSQVTPIALKVGTSGAPGCQGKVEGV